MKKGENMKLLTKIIGAFAIVVGLAGCDNVPAGYVGVTVDKYGGDKGVGINVRGPGKYMPEWNVDQFLFPTFSQSKVWDNKPPIDESFEFQAEGMRITTNVGVTYHIKKDDAPKVFQKYRKGMDEITDVFLRAMIRDTLSTVGATYKADEVHTTKRGELEKAVENAVKEQAAVSGITVERVYFVGGMGLPPQVVESINAKVKATQDAQAKQNELESTKAEVAKLREAADGDAYAIRTRGKALREFPEVLDQMKLEKWDGKMPQVVSGGNVSSLVNLK